MLTNMQGANNLTGYQTQLITPKVSNVNASNKLEKPDSSINQTDDTVHISMKAKELDQVYREKENSIEQNYDANRQQLEREYLRQKNELEREFARKKQTLNINLYV